MKEKKLLLLFPDGVGIRNFLYTDVFKDTNLQLILFHNFDIDTIIQLEQFTGITDMVEIPKYNETVLEKFLRELICLSRLKYNAKITNNKTILSNWKSKHSSFLHQLFYNLIYFSSIFIWKYSQILILESCYQKVIRKTTFLKKTKQLLVKINPQVLFCSHQRGIQCAPIFAAAKDLGILTTTVIYSWDNLPKARMALRADKYLVWSDYMKNELKLYYPEIKSEQISVTGTPQFECYHNPNNIIEKEEFYRKYNLDLNKKIICYSGDDILTSPDDPSYLDDLADELIKNGLDNDYQILLRRCPVDISNRFYPIILKYSTLIKQAPPLWNFKANSSWTTIYPFPDDIKLLVSTAYYSDVVVNLGSTMVFDFAMFRKPCIYINYDQLDQINPSWTVKTIYKFQHFKSMPNANVVKWWLKKEDISSLLKGITFDETTLNWIEIVLSEYTIASRKVLNEIQ
jgi:hypothetical protein